MKFLVVGCGSIGRRHISSLLNIGVEEVLVHDANSQHLESVEREYGIAAYDNLEEALAQNVKGMVVSVPPSLHIPIARKGVEHGVHLLIEKPLSNTLDGVDSLLDEARRKGLCVLVGYNLRFHQGLRLLKKLVAEGAIGTILSARLEMGLYLPDWRPDYKDIYSAKKDLGGGVLLDHSHEIDYIQWLLGDVQEVACFVSSMHSLGLETEDLAEIMLRFQNGAVAGVHFDIVQRTYSRSCKLIGDKGTLVWKYPSRSVSLYSVSGGEWKDIGLETDEENIIIDDAVYQEEMEHFIKCISGEAIPLVSGETARRVLEIALAAKESAEKGIIIRM